NAVGFVYGKLGRHQEALESYREALAISRELRDRPGEGTVLNNIGMIYDVQGERRQALDFYLRSIAVKESVRTSARLEELKTGLAEQAVMSTSAPLSSSWIRFNRIKRSICPSGPAPAASSTTLVTHASTSAKRSEERRVG